VAPKTFIPAYAADLMTGGGARRSEWCLPYL
jgi:hypothetical protein